MEGIKNCFQQASKTIWKEEGRATEKATLPLVRTAEKGAEESGVPWKTRFPCIQYIQYMHDPEKEGLVEGKKNTRTKIQQRQY